MTDILQIPATILHTMSLQTLASTCLDYPLLPDIFAADNYQNGMLTIIKDFNGFQELFKQTNAHSVLCQRYLEKDPSILKQEWNSIQKGKFAASFIFLELTLAQDDIVSCISPDIHQKLIKKLLQNIELNNLFGIPSIKSSAFLMGRILIRSGSPDIQSKLNQNENIRHFIETSSLADENIIDEIIGIALKYVDNNKKGNEK